MSSTLANRPWRRWSWQTRFAVVRLAGVDHFERLLHRAEHAIGTPRYKGIRSEAEQDRSFIDAYANANSHYSTKEEPVALDIWEDDTGSADASLEQLLAVGRPTKARLRGAVRNVERRLVVARHDVAVVMGAASCSKQSPCQEPERLAGARVSLG